jgi:hypothetical protein
VGGVPLTVQEHQGLHGEGFVFALASAAGLLASRPVYDVDGVDWLICNPGRHGKVRSPKIELQVKTWSRPVGNASAWRYRLRTAHFNALAGQDFSVRRFLVMVTVPPEASDYARCDPQCMRLGHAAYWLSLADQQPILDGPEAPQTVTVSVPARNLLTPQALVALVSSGGGKT